MVYGCIMAVEIELKARLDGFEPVKERLSVLAKYCRSYTKSDAYWLPAQADSRQLVATIPSGVRVRRESGLNADGSAFDTILVTYKTKEITDGIEVNDECEFTVSDAAVFEELLLRLGLCEAIRKEKKGWAWTVPAAAQAAAKPPQPAILAELSSVTGLGWFLEIEIQVAGTATADSSRQAVIEESRRRLLALLETLEIPADRIEPRPYTVMLKEVTEEQRSAKERL
jgi:adenylate cyclase class 2